MYKKSTEPSITVDHQLRLIVRHKLLAQNSMQLGKNFNVTPELASRCGRTRSAARDSRYDRPQVLHRCNSAVVQQAHVADPSA